MTAEQKRIKIAEACGWTCCGQVGGCEPHGYPPNARKPTTRELIDGNGPSAWDIPDYLNDLNAMHEAEKTLTDQQRSDFVDFICFGRIENVASCDYGTHQAEQCLSATAAQRAEAFGLTLNLWNPGD